jgi:hypothetical protein
MFSMSAHQTVDNLCYYIINKIDLNVLKSLSSEQLSAIKDAINACQLRTKHPVNIRGTIRLFFISFYCVFLVGRDRRASTLEIEGNRREKVTFLENAISSIVVFSLVLSAFTLLSMIGLYGLKSFLGIDLFPGEHMGKIFSL